MGKTFKKVFPTPHSKFFTQKGCANIAHPFLFGEKTNKTAMHKPVDRECRILQNASLVQREVACVARRRDCKSLTIPHPLTRELPLHKGAKCSHALQQKFNAQTGNAQICSRRSILTRLASRSTLPRPTHSGVSTCSHHAKRGRGQPSLGRDFRNRLFSQRTERLMKFQTKSKQIDRLLIAVKTLVVPPL